MKIPRPSPKTDTLFRSLVPKGKNITIKPMFGNPAAFVNGNLFIGLYGDDFLFRLPEEAVLKLITEEGASRFEPMKGRKMGGYAVAPRSWLRDQARLRQWVGRSLEWSSKLPAKSGKKRGGGTSSSPR